MLRPDARCIQNPLEKGFVKRGGDRGIPNLVLNNLI